MTIADRLNPQDFVEMTRDGDQVYDCCLRVRVAADGFSGERACVWFGQEEVRKFRETMWQMERTRTGEAELRSITPREFRLRLFMADALGLLGLEGELWHERVGRGNGVVFGFTLSGEYLLGIFRDFEELALLCL